MPGYLCVLSARTSEQLRHRAEDLLAFCERLTEVDLGNMCYTLLLGRSHDNHRLACVVRTLAELIRYLRMWLERGSLLQVYVAEIPEGQQRQRASLTRYGNQCIEVCRQTDDPGGVPGTPGDDRGPLHSGLPSGVWPIIFGWLYQAAAAHLSLRPRIVLGSGCRLAGPDEGGIL